MGISASAIRAGEAYIELTADDAKLARALKQASARLAEWGARVGQVGSRLMAVGAGLAAPLLAAAKQFSDVGDAVHKAAARTGLSTEAVSELGFAAEQSGADFESLESGLRRMQRALAEARGGGEAAREAFSRIGLSAEKLAWLAPEEQFAAIADQIGRIDDPAERARAAMDIFGRGGAALIPLLAEGSDGIAALRARARELGRSLSGEDAAAAAAFNDAMNELATAAQAVGMALGQALSPVLREVTDSLTAAIVAAGKWLAENRQWVVFSLRAAAGLVAVGAALKAVSAAAALASLNPLTLALGAAAAAAALLYAELRRQRDEMLRVRTASADRLAEADRQRAADLAAMDRLRALADQERLSNRQREEAATIIRTLTDRYGELGLKLDETTGKIVGLDEAHARMVESMRQTRLAQLEAALSETDANIIGQQQTMRESVGYWAQVREFFGGGSNEAIRKEARAQLEAARLRKKALRQQIDELKSGGGTLVGEAAGTQSAEPGLSLSKPEAIEWNTDALRIEQRMAERLHELRIEQIEDEEARAIAAIEARYAAERLEAEMAGADVTLVDEAREAELSAARDKFARQRDEQQQEHARNVADYESDLELETRRAEIEATKTGRDRELALLDLEREKELKKARELGADASKVEELFDWRRRAIESADVEMPKLGVAGTFNPFAALGLGGGGPMERTARATEETAKNTKKLVQQAQHGALVFG